MVVAVRSILGSDRYPHFDAVSLAESPRAEGIDYEHLDALGGRRSSERSDSPNGAWENDSFQAYADYALTDPFQDALDELIPLGEERTPAIMCAEAVYWRCHRRIVADWLITRGHDVLDIFDPDRADEHDLTHFASAEDGRVVYPPEADSTD